MSINIRNDVIERNIDRIRDRLIRDLGVKKLSNPQIINELICFYERRSKGGRSY